MAKTLSLEDVSAEELRSVSVNGVNLLRERDYLTSEDLFRSLRESEKREMYGFCQGCVWSQCVYGKTC